jgi:hypothetical protein
MGQVYGYAVSKLVRECGGVVLAARTAGRLSGTSTLGRGRSAHDRVDARRTLLAAYVVTAMDEAEKRGRTCRLA